VVARRPRFWSSKAVHLLYYSLKRRVSRAKEVVLAKSASPPAAGLFHSVPSVVKLVSAVPGVAVGIADGSA